jgi:hypothetical protein
VVLLVLLLDLGGGIQLASEPNTVSGFLIPVRRRTRLSVSSQLYAKSKNKQKKNKKTKPSSSTNKKNSNKNRPRLVVFDLDGCLWKPELFELIPIRNPEMVLTNPFLTRVEIDDIPGTTFVSAGGYRLTLLGTTEKSSTTSSTTKNSCSPWSKFHLGPSDRIGRWKRSLNVPYT